MAKTTPTRRQVLLGSATAASALSWPTASVRAAPPSTESITSQLVEAARMEGQVIWYTSVDLQVAEIIAKAFQAKFPGIAVRVERTGAERVFQRIGQERASNIFACDVAQSSDAAHFIAWKREGVLTPCVPEDVAKHFPAQHKDVDGLFASWRVWLCGIGYNTKLVKAEEAPKSFADLLDPKWTGKLVKAHPSYSGTIMTATQQIARDLGWSYFEKLAKQKVMQVQSAGDPPRKLALGERAIMVDGADYLVTLLKEKGEPIEFVYATEGTPLITGPAAIASAKIWSLLGRPGSPVENRSGSANTTSSAITAAPASVRRVTSSATRVRGHGHWPYSARAASSMSMMRTGKSSVSVRGFRRW